MAANQFRPPAESMSQFSVPQSSITSFRPTLQQPAAGQLTSAQITPVSGTSGTSPPCGDANPVALCRSGQETLIDIVQRTTEIFTLMRSSQLVNGTNLTMSQFTERKPKLDDNLKRVDFQFAKLREIYDAVVEASSSIEPRGVEELLPIKDSNCFMDTVETADVPVVKNSSSEEKHLIQQLKLKNRQLKEIIDRQREIVWEINTMMAVRRNPLVEK